MRKLVLLFAIIAVVSVQLYAVENDGLDISLQDSVKHWKIGGIGSFNFSQGYQTNWVAGGENSISTLTIFNLYANYSNKKTTWENTIDVKYGLLKSGDENGLRKNEDLIELNSKYGHSFSKSWYYSALFNLKTQAVKGYEYPNDSIAVSDFFAPAYIVLAFGFDYKPNDKLSVLISPLTSKTVFINDTSVISAAKYGIENGKSKKEEMGAYLKTYFKIDLTKDILVENKIDLFSSYIKNPQNIDINWELNVSLKINSHINTRISTHLIYDDDIDVPLYDVINGVKEKVGTSKRIQFKEVLSLGFSYKF